MPTFESPIHLPRRTTEEFKAAKAAYVAEHGYRVTFPKLSDIISLHFRNDPTPEEWRAYKQKDVDTLGVNRYQEIQELQAKKRRNYQRMIASPVGWRANEIGSVMTFLDDVNDTLGTAAIIASLACRLLPLALAGTMAGPIGWLALGAQIAGIGMTMVKSAMPSRMIKRTLYAAARANPYTKRAYLKGAKKLRKLSKPIPAIIEAAQVSQNVCGVGLCLGPLVGCVLDVGFGLLRTIKGERVTWGSSAPTIYDHEIPSLRLLRNAPAMARAIDTFDDDDILATVTALNASSQLLHPLISSNNPLDHAQGLQDALFEAPVPTSPITRDILREDGIDPDQASAWPGLGTRHATLDTLFASSYQAAGNSLFNFAKRNRRNYGGMVASQNAFDSGMEIMQLLEGEGSVEYEDTPETYMWENFFNDGMDFTPYSGSLPTQTVPYQINYQRFGPGALAAY